MDVRCCKEIIKLLNNKFMIHLNSIKTHFAISLMMIYLLLILISCEGCRSGKVVTIDKRITVDSTDKIERIVHKPSKYPIVDGIVSYINDSTRAEDGVKFIGPENGKILFPNGKVITQADYPIMRDLPEKHNKFPGEFSGFYDFSKINDSQKKALLSNMDGYDPKKLKNYTEAMFSLQQYLIYDDQFKPTKLERVFIVTDLIIFEEVRKSEDDIRQFVIGRIGLMEVYDKLGNKLKEIKLDKFGCSEVCVTPDKKYIIINSHGPDENDEITMCNTGAITIYSYKNYEMVETILHFPNDISSFGIGCDENYIGLVSKIPDSDSLHKLNIKINERAIFTLRIPEDKRYQVGFKEDGEYYQFGDGTKIEKGNPNFNQYTLKEWNNYVRNNRVNYLEKY